MAAQKRIYVVTTDAGARLVEAASRAQAISYVAKNTITADVASQRDLVSLVAAGVSVEGMGEPLED